MLYLNHRLGKKEDIWDHRERDTNRLIILLGTPPPEERLRPSGTPQSQLPRAAVPMP